MIQSKFHFISALTSSGWQKNVVVSVHKSGMIESVEAGEKGGTLITGIAIQCAFACAPKIDGGACRAGWSRG
jgi:hypothetical protein